MALLVLNDHSSDQLIRLGKIEEPESTPEPEPNYDHPLFVTTGE